MSRACDRLSTDLTTGGPFRRWRARRHAARCPRCFVIRSQLEAIADTLAVANPLADADRRLWLAAIPEAPIEVRRPSRLAPALAGSLATGLVAGLLGWWMLRPPASPETPQGAEVVISRVENRRDSSRRLEGLEKEVVALRRELDDLARRADLLDVRREVAALEARLPARRPDDF